MSIRFKLYSLIAVFILGMGRVIIHDRSQWSNKGAHSPLRMTAAGAADW